MTEVQDKEIQAKKPVELVPGVREKKDFLAEKFAQLVEEHCAKPHIQWLFGEHWQNREIHNGGFSPYPETLEAGGVLATADVLYSLLVPINEKEYQKTVKTLEKMRIKKYWQEPAGVVGESTVFRDVLAKTTPLSSDVRQAIEFLLEANPEDQDGGFPPLADTFWIKEVSFSDATSAGVRGLLASLDFIRTQPEKIRKGLEEKIRQRLTNAVNWILENKRERGNGTYWSLTKYHKEGYVFGTVLALSALSDYLDHFSEDPRIAEIKKTRDGGIVYLMDLFAEHGFLPFSEKATQKEPPSLTNTALALEVFWQFLKRDEKIEGVNMKQLEGVCKAQTKQLERYALEKRVREEDDELDLRKLQKSKCPYVPEFYPVPRGVRSAILSLVLTAYTKEELSQSEYFYREMGLLAKRISELEKAQVPFEGIVKRAGREVSTSVIAGNLSVFRKLVAKAKQ